MGQGAQRRQPVQGRRLRALQRHRHRGREEQVGRLRDQELRGTSVGFTPTWYQVFPAVDLSRR